MYEAYWGLRSRPFENTPDPRFLYRSAEHAEAFAKLLYVVEQRLGGALLAGDPGVGKSLVVHALVASLSPERYQAVVAYAPGMGAQDVILSVLAALGEQDIPRMVEQLTAQAVGEALERRLSQAEQSSRHPVVFLDDADLLAGDEALGMCRYLMGRTKGAHFRLTLILVANLELPPRIAAEPGGALESRLAVKVRLRPLSEPDARAYILHRLQVAGAQRGLFTEQAAARICQASGGVPARINRLCDLALLTGYGLELERIVPEVVDLVLEQAGLEQASLEQASV
jgi:general secretion pathway protein A